MIDPKSIHKKFIRIGKMRHKLKNQLLVLLPKIYKTGIYKKYAASIYEYAAKYGDLSKYAVQTRLRLEPNLENKPHLKAAISTAGVKKVAMVAKLATPETEEIFAQKIKTMSKSAVQILSRELRQAPQITKTTIVKCEAKPENIKLELDDEMSFLFMKIKKKYGENLSNKEVMRRILKNAVIPEKSGISNDVTEREPGLAESDHGKLEEKSHKSLPGQTNRYIRAYTKRHILSRSHGQCEYNGCNKPAEHFHHTKRFAETHTHEGIVHVCKDHHQILHSGLVRNEEKSPKTWTLSLNQRLSFADEWYQRYRVC